MKQPQTERKTHDLTGFEERNIMSHGLETFEDSSSLNTWGCAFRNGGRTMTGSRLTFHRTVVLAFAFGLAIIALGVSALAADPAPATRAARLTYLQGTVMVNQGGGTASVPAQLNLPLLAGVQLVTSEDGQAEVEFEDGSVVRLTPNSALSLDALSVDPNGVFTTDLSLLHGLAYAELRATPQYHYWLNAGGDTVSPVENATVRVAFDEPPAIFAVLDGTAHVERQNGAQADVRAGESLSVDSSQANYLLTQGINPDTWDQWNEDLDQSAAAQAADTTDVRNNYAGPDGYGWSDLDANGTWYDVPGQGPVWQPELAVDDSGFDPYGYGSWVNYPGVGYLWASGYAWGWTPYRCGSWSYFGGFGWGWAPGTGCGGFGWGFIGGGFPVNIGIYPAGYRPIRVPGPGRSPGRPLIQVRTYTPLHPSPTARPVAYGQHQIAGVAARPIAPVHNNASSGGVATGSALRRDYPVDSQTRTPVLGLAGTRPAMVYTPGAQPAGRPARSSAPVPAARLAPATSYGEPSRPAGSSAGQPALQTQRPTPSSAPAQRYSPPSQPAAHPIYSPPPQRYTPPPSAPPAPRYTPPPAPRYSPPPSPPPASHPSSPPPAPSASSHPDRARA